jgi:hypothetical protein
VGRARLVAAKFRLIVQLTMPQLVRKHPTAAESTLGCYPEDEGFSLSLKLSESLGALLEQ